MIGGIVAVAHSDLPAVTPWSSLSGRIVGHARVGYVTELKRCQSRRTPRSATRQV